MINKLSADIVNDFCSAKAGLESKAIIINRTDIDMAALTESGATVTNLSLLSGATGFSIEWVKNIGSTASEFALSETSCNKFNQSFACRMVTSDAQSIERLSELANGEFVIVVETRHKGTNLEAAYKVYGLGNGLFMSESGFSVIENDGTTSFVLASQEGYGEKYQSQVWNEGTYQANKAKFDAKFAG